MHKPSSGVVMDVAPGESIRIDSGRVVVIVEQKSGQKARLRIIAGPSVLIERPNKIAAEAV